MQVSIWLECESSAPTAPDAIEDSAILGNIPHWCPTYSIDKVDRSYRAAYDLGMAKDLIGLVVTVAFIGLFGLAMRARVKQEQAVTQRNLQSISTDDCDLPEYSLERPGRS